MSNIYDLVKQKREKQLFPSVLTPDKYVSTHQEYKMAGLNF